MSNIGFRWIGEQGPLPKTLGRFGSTYPPLQEPWRPRTVRWCPGWGMCLGKICMGNVPRISRHKWNPWRSPVVNGNASGCKSLQPQNAPHKRTWNHTSRIASNTWVYVFVIARRDSCWRQDSCCASTGHAMALWLRIIQDDAMNQTIPSLAGELGLQVGQSPCLCPRMLMRMRQRQRAGTNHTSTTTPFPQLRCCPFWIARLLLSAGALCTVSPFSSNLIR